MPLIPPRLAARLGERGTEFLLHQGPARFDNGSAGAPSLRPLRGESFLAIDLARTFNRRHRMVSRREAASQFLLLLVTCACHRSCRTLPLFSRTAPPRSYCVSPSTIRQRLTAARHPRRGLYKSHMQDAEFTTDREHSKWLEPKRRAKVKVQHLMGNMTPDQAERTVGLLRSNEDLIELHDDFA